ncbi:hypothetical protein ACGFI9_01505 [Micromonospora sp. NPDC048930]|uniref:hypothetical protein n=1 Tax=Micromonospora sp. NPDC048930 TaxID=3364261 RepID=UPI0037243D56
MTAITSTGYLIELDELRAALADVEPCPDCAGGLGIHVEPGGEWNPVAVHNVPCPRTPGRPRLTAVPNVTP